MGFLMVTLFALSVAFSGILTPPLLVVVPQEVVGAALGVVNTAAQIAAFASPLLVGYALTVTNSDFTLVFYGCGGLLVFAAAAAHRIRQPVDVREQAPTPRSISRP